jgi:hypothetical protein
MAHQHTTDTSVFAIITAFTSGLDVIKKLKKKRKKGKDAGNRVDEEEDIRLSRSSFQRSAIDIRQEYERSYGYLGESFRVGQCE